MNKRAFFLMGLAALAAAAAFSQSNPPVYEQSAAAYLDQRANWWMGWPNAVRDHETFCVSCHTAVPYALSRPALRTALGEQVPSAAERRLLDNLRKRVRLWDEVEPFYKDRGSDPKAAQSRGTEAVLNALILARYDAQNGKLSADTRAAFHNMWALQLATGNAKGAWSWLRFDLEPWEGKDSQYYGATLAAVAVGMAPENYRSLPEIQSNLELLSEYLDREYAAQPSFNRAFLLWASAKLPGLLETAQQKSIINELISKQEADGGWSLPSLGSMWTRKDGTPQETKSDGYATGLVTFALQQAGIPRENVQLQKALSWLRANQNKTEGYWPASSLNKQRDPSSDAGRFMIDAATAFAALALTESNSHNAQTEALKSRLP